MSKRSWKIVFQDMLDAITKIEQYTRNMSFDDFAGNSMAIDAVVRNIEILGEASRHLSNTFRNQYQQIPWNKIAGIRNRIVHEYFGVDITIIWFIVRNELNPLKHNFKKSWIALPDIRHRIQTLRYVTTASSMADYI